MQSGTPTIWATPDGLKRPTRKGRPSDIGPKLCFVIAAALDGAVASERSPALDRIPLAFDTAGGEASTTVRSRLAPSARLVSIGDGRVVASTGPRGTFFVVETDREGPSEIAKMVDASLLRLTVSRSAALSDGPELIGAEETALVQGKVSIRTGERQRPPV